MFQKGMRKKAISCLLGIICVWPLSILFAQWLPIGDYIHLAVAYPEYRAKIESSPNARLQFNWGATGFAGGPSSDRMLIYDPTDKLPQENKLKDAELRARNHHFSNGHIYFDETIETRHLFGHFYLVTAFHQ